MTWWTRRICAFDTETTGVDVESDRIVTATVAFVGGGRPTTLSQWLIDPGIDIPAEAAAIHGITTDRARAEGEPARWGLNSLARCLRVAIGEGIPVVAYNAAYDLSILVAELARHGLDPIPEPLVIDPLVIDRALDPWRKGPRKLVDACRHYGVPLSEADAHDATADAIAAARLAYRMGDRYQLGELEDLQQLQRDWHRQWAESFSAWLRSKGRTHDLPDPDGWPFKRIFFAQPVGNFSTNPTGGC